MKSLVLCLLMLCFALPAFAADIRVGGEEAEKLYTALTDVGAVKDCEYGRCTIVAKDVTCVERGRSVGAPYTECSMQVERKYRWVELSTGGETAGRLYSILQTVGIEADCGMGKCGVAVPALSCEATYIARMRPVITCNLFAEAMMPAVLTTRESPITKIEGATLVCQQPGGMYAINVKDERVWQGDPGEKEGLELDVTEFRKMRCPNCFDITGTLSVFGDSVQLKLQTRGLPGSFTKATLDAFMQDGGKMEKIATMACETVRE